MVHTDTFVDEAKEFKDIPLGEIGCLFDYPTNGSWFEKLVWKIKKKLGIQKRKGIKVIVSNTLPYEEDNKFYYLGMDASFGVECICGNKLITDEEIRNGVCKECQ